MLFPIVSASVGHMMGEVSAVSQGSRSLRDDRPQVPFLLWFIRARQFSVMEIHLNHCPPQPPSVERVESLTGHLWARRHTETCTIWQNQRPAPFLLMWTFIKLEDLRKGLRDHLQVCGLFSCHYFFFLYSVTVVFLQYNNINNVGLSSFCSPMQQAYVRLLWVDRMTY